MTLLKYLEDYTNTNALPMHMPGHKRNTKLASYLKKLYANCDLTEIHGMDDLHAPEGILNDCMKKAEKLWNSQHSFYVVNGSTGGILAGIRACTTYGDSILVARNCHKSVYNAIELLGLNPIYILPDILENYPIYTSINTIDVFNALKENKNIKLVVLTSPTYEGIISNIVEITKIAHSFNVPVLVDEAHGSHLDLSPYFTNGSVKGCADITVQSLHKTLPSLTQTAILHLNSDIITPQQIQRQLSIFQTSSPSYLLMSSIDSCIELITEHKELFEIWHKNLEYFKNEISKLKNLEILGYTKSGNISKEIYAFDKSKIVISTANTNINGNILMDILRTKYNIELEMCSGDYAIAMTSMADVRENLERLAKALLEIDSSIFPAKRKTIVTSISNLPTQKIVVSKAVNGNYKTINISESKGFVSAEYIWVYPPGIPFITPGEIITDEIITSISTAISNKMNLQKTISTQNSDVAVIIDVID